VPGTAAVPRRRLAFTVNVGQPVPRTTLPG
jgi:hypothetical protein